MAESGVIRKETKRIFKRVREIIIDENQKMNRAQNAALRNFSLDRMGQASAWGMARRRPLEYRRKVDAATHCSGACSHT